MLTMNEYGKSIVEKLCGYKAPEILIFWDGGNYR